MQSPDSPLVILPAAGFGRRMGSPESKETLPIRNGAPLIQKPLDECLKRKWPVLVITRREKQGLIEFIEAYKDKGLNLDICFVEQTKEWPESIMRSKEFWKTWNLVLLPDTEFGPPNILDQAWSKASKDYDLIIAQHNVSDSAHWGVLKPTESGVQVGEKVAGERKAWGLYQFNKAWGEKILQAQLTSYQRKKWVQLEGCRSQTIELDFFKDLTRGS